MLTIVSSAIILHILGNNQVLCVLSPSLEPIEQVTRELSRMSRNFSLQAEFLLFQEASVLLSKPFNWLNQAHTECQG